MLLTFSCGCRTKACLQKQELACTIDVRRCLQQKSLQGVIDEESVAVVHPLACRGEGHIWGFSAVGVIVSSTRGSKLVAG